MSVSKIAFILSAIASLAVAETAAQTAELQAIISDINSHLSDYLGLETGNSGFQIPSDVLSVYQQVITYSDDAYTTLFSELDFDAITKTIVALPWYTTRLSSEIAAAVASVSQVSSKAASSSAASSSSKAASSSAASSSSKAASSSATSSSSSVGTASNAGQRVNAGAGSFGAVIAGAAALLL